MYAIQLFAWFPPSSEKHVRCPLELELEVTSLHMRVLATVEPGSLARTAKYFLTTEPSLQSSLHVPNINFLFNICCLVLSALLYPEITVVARF